MLWTLTLHLLRRRSRRMPSIIACASAKATSLSWPSFFSVAHYGSYDEPGARSGHEADKKLQADRALHVLLFGSPVFASRPLRLLHKFHQLDHQDWFTVCLLFGPCPLVVLCGLNLICLAATCQIIV